MLRFFNRKLHNRKGFTLIELIVVIAILAILALIAIPRFTGFQESAAEKAALAEGKIVQTAIEGHKANTGNWPTVAEVNTFIGKTLPGAISPDPIADGSFTYTITIQGKSRVVTGTAAGGISVATTP